MSRQIIGRKREGMVRCLWSVPQLGKFNCSLRPIACIEVESDEELLLMPLATVFFKFGLIFATLGLVVPRRAELLLDAMHLHAKA